MAKKQNWTPQEDNRLRQAIREHLPIEKIAKLLCKSEMAVYLYTYRHRIPLRKMMENPMMRRLVEIKFGDVEYFVPTRSFYVRTGITQKRWAELVFGYAQPSQVELKAAALALNFSVEEAFKLMEARQLNLFEL